MGRLGEAIEEQREVKGPDCQVGSLMARLEPDDADDLRAGLLGWTDPQTKEWFGASATAIMRALQSSLEIEVSADALRRHRRTLRQQSGGCRCRI